MNAPNILDRVKIWRIRRPLKNFDFLGCQQSHGYQIVDNERIADLQHFIKVKVKVKVSRFKWTLQVAGLHGQRPVKKPLVSLKKRKARVEWAKQHLSWGPREWANHIWSDESKFNLFGTDGIQWIRRPIGSRYAPQYQCQTVKYGGGSVMIWGCFSDTSMGSLKRIVGTMDQYNGFVAE
uniref:HTH_Tnp_Tc3_2 domain-containing protein n=1 Tax=Caenorhabditis japonica TaxID=281687 RepID=A0A8R1DS15_CAEJA